MAAKFKVYRTPIGFHDAYVAAPSQAAALRAWGADANLFARGVAEQVIDPALTEAALAQPGVVIRKLRGTAAEQFAALPPDPPRAPAAKQAPRPTTKPKPAPKPKPPPSRAALDRADEALAEACARHEQEDAALAAREAALAREREQATRQHATERARLERALETARADYNRALEKWSG